MENSIDIARTIAVKLYERENPDGAIKDALFSIITGVQSLRRLGFSWREIKEEIEKVFT